MIQLLEYRNNDYFNEKDFFLFYDLPLKKVYLSQLENFNGNYYPKEYKEYLTFSHTSGVWSNRGPSQFKMTSVKSLNYSNLIGLKMKYKGTELTGKIEQRCVLNSFGIFWDKKTAQYYKKYGFPNTWVDLNDIELL